jgi:predicted 2-oxoglutarate/Fe(II)-dependent dioxygenase YbiX
MNKLLEKSNFIYIKNFISSERSYELAKEFIRFTKENNISNDSQVQNASAYYNHIDFLELLCEKTPEVSKFLGETVLPTYSFARVYKNGATLEKHTDRNACEISLTINLSGDESWPIWIKTPDGKEVSLDLESGDAMMYLGCHAEHWREQYQGKEYVQVFLHYVKSRGENSWAVFDKIINPPDNIEKKSNQIAAPKNKQSEDSNNHNSNHIDFLKEYICVFENVVSDEICDLILAEYQDNSVEWCATAVGSDSTIDRSIRNADVMAISRPEVIQKNPDVRQLIDNKMWECAGGAIQLYNKKWPMASIEQDSGYELLRYNEGYFYTQHCDHFKAQPRTVSCSFALNDDYEGGEFAFFDKKLKYKLKKGSVIMFPSNFMFPHEIMEVTKGTRYSVITWFV